MATIQEHIAYFLRDAQYRLGELAGEKLKIQNPNSARAKEIRKIRFEIYSFLFVLYESYHDIYDEGESGFTNDWTDDEILAEIEYLRDIANISEIPWLDFPGVNQEIVQVIGTSGSSANIENSTIGYIAYFKTISALAGKPLSDTAGKLTSDIDAFFAGTISSTVFEIPFVVNPAFTEAQWTGKNPTLKRGQIGYVLDGNGLVIDYKVGPGKWNDLTYLGSGVYPYNENISNQLGDLPVNPYGLSIPALLRLIINPYVAPILSNALNNSSGSYLNDKIFEIGQSISGTINVQYTIDDASKLSGGTPINVTAGGIFSNEGNFAHGTIGLTLAASYGPLVPTTVTISIRATHTNGLTNTITTTIKFFPRIIWGVGQNTSIVASDLLNGAGLTQKQNVVANDYKREYSFTASGYLYIAIPSMLSPSNLVWADTGNSLVPKPIEMVDLGTINNVNNGVGTYNYQIFRSKFAVQSSSSKITIG